jgi:uncharacterized membrane protein
MVVKKIAGYIRKHMITGIIVIIPIWVTYVAVRAVMNWINGLFDILPTSVQPKTLIPIWGIEIIIALLLILIIGLLANNYLGKKFLSLGEFILAKIPVIKTIYQGVKHLTAGVMSEKKMFSRVVMLEFPIKGLSFIGFVTGETPSLLPEEKGKKMLKIFIPTTPNPTSGYFCMASEDEVKPLDMSVDDAFRLIISAGYADSAMEDIGAEKATLASS